MRVRNKLELSAILDTAGVVRAGIDSTLQMALFPAHDEVAVTAIARRIALGEDKWLAVAIPPVLELVGIPDNLKE